MNIRWKTLGFWWLKCTTIVNSGTHACQYLSVKRPEQRCGEIIESAITPHKTCTTLSLLWYSCQHMCATGVNPDSENVPRADAKQMLYQTCNTWNLCASDDVKTLHSCLHSQLFFFLTRTIRVAGDCSQHGRIPRDWILKSGKAEIPSWKLQKCFAGGSLSVLRDRRVAR